MVLLDELKPRERDVLRLMSDGMTNREIASELFISLETVRWYSKQIYSKLDVGGRKEAAEKAQALGLLNESDGSETAQSQLKGFMPAQLTSFIGREKQIIDIMRLMKENPIITLTGPGGTGKTRLALRIAEQLLNDYADGVYFIDLAPVPDSDMVPDAIARALSVNQSVDESMLDVLRRAIGQREILLVLDNYEHVIDSASLVSNLIAGKPGMKVIVTSREPLRVAGEQIYAVPPMTLPQNVDVEQSEAVALFVRRAQAMKSTFQLDESITDDVVTICQRLDGMPLAIELASSLTRFLTPDKILDRLTTRFQTLTGGRRDAPSRHQTLRNTIDWSYNLLSDAEKILFARMAIFRGGRSLEAIEAICDFDLPANIFDTLASLVDKSMLRQIEDFNGEPRFVMLETLHEYAMERLQASGELDRMHERHARYFRDLTVDGRRKLRQTGQIYWFEKYDLELENIRLALDWAFANDDTVPIALEIIGNLRDFWYYRGYHQEGIHLVERAKPYLDKMSANLQTGIHETATFLHYVLHNVEKSLDHLDQAFKLANDQLDTATLAFLNACAIQMIYSSYRTDEAYNKSLDYAHNAITMSRDTGDDITLAQALNCLGNIHMEHGNLAEARQAYDDCLELCKRTGEIQREAITLGNLASVSFLMNDFLVAKQYLRDAIRICRDGGFNYMAVMGFGHPVFDSESEKDMTTATLLLGVAETLMNRMNVRQQPSDIHVARRVKEMLQDGLGESRFQELIEQGRKLSMDEAFALALKEDE